METEDKPTVDFAVRVSSSITDAFVDRLAYWWFQLSRNVLSIVGLSMIVTVVVCTVLAPYIAPYHPIQGDIHGGLEPPSLSHFMGTDEVGRDVFSRALWAGRVDLLIALSAVMISIFLSFVLGSAAGYFGGNVDEAIMRFVDVIMAFPSFLLAIAVAVSLGPGEITSLIFALGIVGSPAYIRLLRAEVLARRERPYVEAARAVGNSHLRIIVVHLLPNCVWPVLVQATLGVGYCIIMAAGLSFVGVGVKEPKPEWGIMINRGTRFILTGQWWISVFPGLMIVLSVLGFNLFGDGLRDILSPKTRRR